MIVLIEIPEEAKRAFDCAESNDIKGSFYDHGGVIGNAIKNGTPIFDNATNGDAIKALYPNRTFFNEDSCCVTMKEYGKTEEDVEYLTYIDFDGDWWKAPYKADKE